MNNNISAAILAAVIAGIFLLINTVLTLTLKNRIEKYHHEVNGMKKELVEAVKGKGEAEGNLKAKAEQKEEIKNASQ